SAASSATNGASNRVRLPSTAPKECSTDGPTASGGTVTSADGPAAVELGDRPPRPAGVHAGLFTPAVSGLGPTCSSCDVRMTIWLEGNRRWSSPPGHVRQRPCPFG